MIAPMRTKTLLIVALLALATAPLLAKSYSADRFDVRIEVQPDGAVHVTETVVFRFDGRYTRVFREISTRRTDGLEIISATMDGVAMPFGDGVGAVEVSGRNRRKVEWRFPGVSDTAHTFGLTYVARGVVRQTETSDVVAWRALPSDHDYSVASSTIEIVSPEVAAATPSVRTRRVGNTTTRQEDDRVVIDATDIRRDGWVEVTLAVPRGTLIQSPPAWQLREQQIAETAPVWIWAAVIAFVITLVPIFALRMRYDAPHDAHPARGVRVLSPPGDASPAIAGALVSDAQISTTHALATFYELADRGVIRVVEGPRRFGQRRFNVHRTNTAAPEDATSRAVLDAVFLHKGRHETTVPQHTVGRRLAGKPKPFAKALLAELKADGLMDPERTRLRQRALVISLTLMLLGGASALSLAFLIQDFGAWPLVVSAAVFGGGLVSLTVMGTITPLSNEGARQAGRWRAYRRHLKDLASGRGAASSGGPHPALTIAVALGLAATWGKYLKRHPGLVPGWFEAAGTADVNGAFVAMLGSSASSSGAAGGAGAGAAAGGGASGAS